MKKIKFRFVTCLLTVLVLSSCAVGDKYSLTSVSIDLEKFNENGIFVTTGDITKKYKSIAILNVVCYDGYKKKENLNTKKKQKTPKYDDVYGSTSSEIEKMSDYEYQSCTIDELFNEIIRQAKEKNANGIIKLDIRNISRQGVNLKTIQTGIELIGQAVRIEE